MVIKMSKKMNFKSLDSLDSVKRVINEAAEAVNDKKRTIQTSAISDVLGGVLGAGAGGALSFAALFGLGVPGLSAAGLTSGLAAAGAVVGGGMAAGIFVLAAPVAALGMGGVALASHNRNKKLRAEKARLYQEAIAKQNAIIKELKDDSNMDKDRIDYLTSLNQLLQKIIYEVGEDLGMEAQPT